MLAFFISTIQSFGAITKPKARKVKPNKRQREATRTEKQDAAAQTGPKSIEAVSAELLSFKTVREGMVILGCVKSIGQTSIEVALPGRMNGMVSVAAISQTYLTLAEKYIENEGENGKKSSDDDSDDDDNEYQPLNNLFEIGQVVCVKVMKVDTSKFNRIHIELSMQPKDIQADFQHHTIHSGMLMCAAIAERQEHGFVLETGVNHLRGFLPDTDTDLKVGGVYFCRVKTATNAATASTAKFQLADTVKLRSVEFDEPNVNHLLPGMLVQFNVTKVLKDGLQGTIFGGNLVAYINEHQLGVSKHSKQPKFQVGAELKARILYVMPLTKIVYLSLNLQNQFKVSATADDAHGKILPNGTIVKEAVVSHIGTGGIVLTLNNNAKGIVSMRSIKGNIKANFDKETVLAKYEPNSVHQVRVLHYDPIDLLHVCSVDPKIINEKYFTANDVKTGDFVQATLQRKVSDGRWAITVGQIKGYIKPIYLAKAMAAEKLQPGRKFKCRILCKSQAKNEIFVTNLKEYMDDGAAILTTDGGLSIDKTYLGVVKQCLKDGWLIEFCDYIAGMVYRNQLTASELSAAERFCVGQTIKVTVMKHSRLENGKQLITLGLADYVTKIGGRVKGKITTIQETGFDVAFPKEKLNGFVPMMYLSDFPSLIHALHRVYQCNDDVEAIGVAQNCYSIRDLTDLCGQPTIVKSLNEIQVGDVIPAVIKNVADELIDVQCLIKDYRGLVQIHLKMFVENYSDAGDVTLIPDQKIFVRVMARNSKLKTLTCTARLDDIWPGSFKHTVEIMRRYFHDLDEIQKRMANGNALKSYRIGQIVEAAPVKSDRMDSKGRPLRTFLLDGDVKLYVNQANDATHKKNEKYKILVVWIDYSNEFLYGTMLPKYLERAAIKQDEENAAQQLLKHRGLKANVIMVLPDVIVVYPTKWTNRFIYIPTRVHYNDFQPIIANGIKECSQMNVSVIDVSGTHFIGMPHNLYEIYLRKIDQKLEFIKLEKVNESDSSATVSRKQKKQKNLQGNGQNAKKIKLSETQPDAKNSDESVEIKSEDEDDAPTSTPNKSKKWKADHVQTDFDENIEIKSESDDDNDGDDDGSAQQNKTPVQKKQKRTLSPVKSAPASKKKRKSENPSQEQPSAKKTPQNLAVKKTPQSQNQRKTPNAKRFSMKLCQMDGAMDLDDDAGTKPRKLPGVSNFWSTDLNVLNEDKEDDADDTESSSEEDDDDTTKRRKLSSKERFQAARTEENRIREIEKSLADDSISPTSIDQFDRLVMAEPNNSRAWINYMVFHVQATEIDRARGVGQKALKTIDVREQQERLNIWVALLNMELRFGSKDAFDEVLKEALLVNEPFNVYSVCLKIFADCKRVQELSDMVLTMTKKFRQNPECWLNAAQAFFEVNLNEKAKALLNRALNSLPERDRKSS